MDQQGSKRRTALDLLYNVSKINVLLPYEGKTINVSFSVSICQPVYSNEKDGILICVQLNRKNSNWTLPSLQGTKVILIPLCLFD